MVYQFQCEECKKIEDKELDPNKEFPKFIKCECGKKMFRKWSAGIVIPEHMKAGDGTNSINYEKSGQIHGKTYY